MQGIKNIILNKFSVKKIKIHFKINIITFIKVLRILIFIGIITFYIININILFFIYFNNINKFNVKFDNLKNIYY